MKLNSLNFSYDKEQERLKADNAIALKELNKEFDFEMDKLKKAQNISTDELKKIYASIEYSKSELSDVEGAISMKEQELSEIQANIAKLSLKKDDIQSIIDEKNERRTFLIKDCSNYETQLMAIKYEKEATEAQLTHSKKSLADIGAKYEAQKTELEAELANIAKQLEEVQTSLDEQIAREEQARNDLAIWESALTKRDENIRVREMKTSEIEGRLSRASNLLKL